MPSPVGNGGGGGGGGEMPNVTIPGVDKTIGPGTVLSEEDLQKIADASGGQLKYENGVLTGENPDGSGPVHIEAGKPLDEGQIHDLHHTVPESGGNGKG
jgi:hypothetical protein